MDEPEDEGSEDEKIIKSRKENMNECRGMGTAAADGDVEMGEVNNSKAFEQIKKMLGKWEGKLYQQSGAVVDTYSEFKLVSNGNTIVEKLVEDGVEMMTTYSDKDGELVIKHYCALGTEPMFTVDTLSEN